MNRAQKWTEIYDQWDTEQPYMGANLRLNYN
jgi:hypothetical protein